MTDERFQELLEAYLDRTLDDAASGELLDAFKGDSDLKARFIEELRLSHSLAGLSLLDDEKRIPSEVIESLRNGENAPDISESVLSELRSLESRVIRFPLTRIASGIAAAIAVTLLVVFNLPNYSDTSLATIANLIDAEWSGMEPLSEGSQIGKRRLKLTAGVARLDFANGVRVTLEGPAEFELIAHDETRLHSGNLTAHVPPEGIGFLVHTERAKVVDLGTTFGVSVGKNGVTDVAVFEGEVEVTSVESNEEKIIHEGSIVTLGEDSEKLTPVKLESRSFRGWPVLFGVLNTGGRIRFVNAQPIRNPREVVDKENIIVFPERFNASAEGNLAVTISEPGHYRPKELIDRETIIDLKGKRVNTYLLQYNPPFVEDAPNSDQVHFVGQVTFDRPVLAVIANRDQLKASDQVLGKSRFEYDSTRARGLEHGDSLSLSVDRKTLSVDWLVMQSLKNGMDQLRVIVDAAE